MTLVVVAIAIDRGLDWLMLVLLIGAPAYMAYLFYLRRRFAKRFVKPSY